MRDLLDKIIAPLLVALGIGAGGLLLKHESGLARVDENIKQIRESQQRIEDYFLNPTLRPRP